jgi:hypothetical protein
MQQSMNSDPQEQFSSTPPSAASSSPPLSAGSVYAPYPPYPSYPPGQPYQPFANGVYQLPAQAPIIVPYPVPATPTEPGYNQALTSVILGAVGLVNLPLIFGFVFCGAPIALALSALGVIFGILGLQSPSRKRLAIIGLALSGVPIALMLLWMLVSAIIGLFS